MRLAMREYVQWASWGLLSLVTSANSAALAPAAPPETTVGMPGRIERLVLPGTELEALPHDDRRAPIVLRVMRVDPHGTAFRYDFEYQGLEPGEFDLRHYLRRKDRSSTADLPALPVRVVATLPPGQVVPNALVVGRAPALGGYRLLLILAIAAWVLGLAAILYLGFLRRRRGPTAHEAAPPATLADRLRPLIDGAMAGTLSQPQLASLERSLHAYWRRRLDLEAAEPARAIETLRAHPDAGPLLEQLERWLHRPGPTERVDPARLLAPYRQLPADALDGRAAG